MSQDELISQRQTDRRTTYHSITASAEHDHRVVKSGTCNTRVKGEAV